jgi:hypothetical protein
MVEDIQNRVRNHLCVFQTVKELIESKDTQTLSAFLKNTNLTEIMQKQIDWFISLGKAMDNKIADKSFDVEKYINNFKK